MATGADFNTRVGNRIVMKSVNLRMLFTNEAAMVSRQPIRLMLVYDRQANGAAPVITDILDSAAMSSQKNVANRDRFLVLRDMVFDMNSFGAATAAASNVQMVKTVFVPLKGLMTTYNAGAAGVGSITTGALYLVYFSTTGAGAADIDVAASTRLAYDA